MAGSVFDTKELMLMSMFNQIIVDDLLQEKELELFEQKKRWYDLWRGEITRDKGLGEGKCPLGWEELKDRMVIWLRDNRSERDTEDILEQCCIFEPYGSLPGWEGNGKARIQASPEARELTLEKICRLLGLEERCQELFP
jgi:hypothetical protein